MKYKRFFHLNSLRLQLLSRSLLVILSLLMLIGVFQYVFMKQFIYTNKIRSIEDQIHLIPDDVWKHDIETSQNVKDQDQWFISQVLILPLSIKKHIFTAG
ncbi:hypothetical protein AAAC51_11990 [Priestia megaterium]